MKRIGLAFEGGLEHRQVPHLARMAEELGFESVWFAEGLGGDAFVLSAACSQATSSIKLGTSVASVFTRSPTILAMAAATVNALSGGRFVLGLGSSHRVQVQGEHGLQYGEPMERVVETVEIVRKALAEGKASHSGRIFDIRGFEFNFRLHNGEIPIYLSAVFEKMARKVGEIGDGIILTTCNLERIVKSIEWMQDGARQVNRDSQMDVADYVACCASDDVEKARRTMRRYVASVLGYYPRYNKQAGDAGFVAEAKMVRDYWVQGDVSRACESISDPLLDSLAIVGRLEECRARIEEIMNAGVKLPLLYYHPTGKDFQRELEGFMRGIAS